MINGSTAFNNAVSAGGYPYVARIKQNGVVVDCDITTCSITKGSVGSEEFNLGVGFVPYVELEVRDLTTALENTEITLDVGVRISDSDTEWITMGYFTVAKAPASAVLTTITAVGRISGVLSGIFPTAPATITAETLLAAIQTAVRNSGYATFTINNVGVTIPSEVLNLDITGLTCRDILGELGKILGCYITEDSEGNVVLFKYNTLVTVNYNGDRMITHPTFNENDFSLAGLKIVYEAGYEDEDGQLVPEKFFTTDPPITLTLANPYITTQTLFNTFCDNCLGLIYTPADVTLAYGDPRLEPFDVLRITDTLGVQRLVPCMGITHTITGGLVTQVVAPGKSEAEESLTTPGPLTQQLESLNAQLLSVNEAVINRLKVSELTAQRISAIVIDAINLTSDTIDAKNINVAQLTATQAFIDALDAELIDAGVITVGDLRAGVVSADIITAINLAATQIDADRLNVTQLVAKQAFLDAITAQVATLGYAHITNGVIDNAKIGYADVNGLSANYAHITSGIIDNAKIGCADVNGLSANYASISDLNAAKGRIDNLEANEVVVNDTLDAANANIEYLKSDWISTDRLVLTGNNKNNYPPVEITESEFNVNKTAYWTKSGNTYTQCTASSVYDADEQYYVRQTVKSIIKAINTANSSDPQVVISNDKLIAASMDVAELSAITADMGELTAGKIKKGNNFINLDTSPASMEFKNASTWASATQGLQFDTQGNLNIKGSVNVTSGNVYTKTEADDKYATQAALTVTDGAIKAEVAAREAAVNMLLDSDAPTLTKVNALYDRYWSDSGNNKIVCSNFSLTDAPEQGLNYGRRFTYDGSVATNNYARAYAFYNTYDNAIPFVPNQTYTATLWARCTNGSGRIRITHSKGDGATSTTSCPIYTLTSYWKKYTYSFTFGSALNTNMNRIWFYALFPTSTAGTVEICGCKLIAGDAVEAYKTTIEQTADNVLIKATKNYSKDSSLTDAQNGGKAAIQSLINVAPEGVQISADKVNITGTTIFNAVSNDASAKAAMLNSELEIGGRNLLLDTSTADTWTLSLNSSNYHVHDCYKTYNPVPSIFDADDLVTISFDWSTTGTSGNFRLECGKVTPYTWGTVVNAIGTRSATSNYVDITSSNTSGHAVITFKITSSQASAATTLEWFRIRVDGADMANKTFTVSNAKAERGNKATDWTPAPEDVQAEIDGKTASWVLKSGNASGASYSTILGYAAEGTQTTFTIDSSTPTTGIKAGDTVRLAYLANNMGTNGTIVYIVGTVKTTPTSATSITLIGHGLDTTVIDGGHILTGTIDANRIGANSITLGKIDSRLQRSLNWYATCDTAAATTAKVATISPATTEFTLSEGVSVNVKFTNTNSGAVGSITLNVNNTGAKSIKYINNTAISNIPSAGYIVSGVTYQFVYDGTYWVIQNLNYNTNDNDRKRISNGVIVAENITQYCIAGRSAEQNVTGHKKLVANLEIDLTFPICYLNQANISGQSYAIASGGTTTNFYTAYPSVNLQNTKASWTGTNRAMCYIKGTLTGQKFKVHSDIFTTSIPSNNDGFAYIPIGIMYSTTQVNFACDNTVYAFRNGSFHKIDTVSDYVTQIDENGIWVTPPELKPTNTSTGAGATGTKINADGLDIYQEGTSVAHYGDYARIGKDGEANTRISPNEVTISASDDISALRITPDGNTQPVWYHGHINKKLSAGNSYTYTHPSGADSNSKITYVIRSKAGGKKTITVTKGQTTAATTVATPFKFKYSATTSALTITNNESSQYIVLYEVSFRKTSTSPLIEVGGVLTLGEYPDIAVDTRLVVGKGTADTAVSNAFEVTNYGNVYANGALYTNGGSTEISNNTVVFGQTYDDTPRGYIYQWKSANVTSNSSGLINLTNAFGITTSNASGIVANCTTPNYKVSGITIWNSYWYGILSPFNSASPSANTTVNLIVSWFRAL